METPKCQKEREGEDFIPKRLLCATENPATGNETIPLLDLKEPSNILACNAGKSSWEFYEDLRQKEKVLVLCCQLIPTVTSQWLL